MSLLNFINISINKRYVNIISIMLYKIMIKLEDGSVNRIVKNSINLVIFVLLIVTRTIDSNITF